jgi:hypothetical protein
MRQALLSSSWLQRTPAGLPAGMPGMADEMDGAIQQAPQPTRQVEKSLMAEFYANSPRSAGTGIEPMVPIRPPGEPLIE